MENKKYLVAEIYYDPNDTEFPWYVRRQGSIPEQGGLSVGVETSSFETIDAACSVLSNIIDNDLEVIKQLINKKVT